MAKQFVHIFRMMTTALEPAPIDAQINEFLEKNHEYKIASVSYACDAGVYEKALVVFDCFTPRNNTVSKLPEPKKTSEYFKKQS